MATRPNRAALVLEFSGMWSFLASLLLRFGSTNLRVWGARRLAALGSRDSVPKLAAALNDHNGQVRRTAIEALSALRSAEAGEALLNRIQATPLLLIEDRAVALHAIHTLGYSAAPGIVISAVDKVLSDTSLSGNKSRDEFVSVARDLLREVAEPKVVASLLLKWCALDKDWSFRRFGKDVLASLEWQPACVRERVLTVLLRDDDPKIALADDDAVECLIGLFGDNSQYVNSFIGANTINPKSEPVGRIAYALGRSGGTRAVDFLLGQIEESNLGYYCAWAVGYSGDLRAIEKLRTVTARCKEAAMDERKKKLSQLVGGAVRGLSQLHSDDAAAALCRVLIDSGAHCFPVFEAIEALERFDDKGIPYLVEALESRPDLRSYFESSFGERANAAGDSGRKKALRQHDDRACQTVGTMSDEQILSLLSDLCSAYTANNKTDISSLEPIATRIGMELFERGGLAEMKRVFNMLGNRAGARTLDMHWDGVGSWRG